MIDSAVLKGLFRRVRDFSMSGDLKDNPSSPGNSRSGKEWQRGEIKTTLQMVCNRQGGLFRPGRDASVHSQ